MRKVDTPEFRALIIDALVRKMSNADTLNYLSIKGYPIKEHTLIRIKNRLKQNKFGRLSDIARIGSV